MGYTLDYFQTDLRCPRCGIVTRASDVEIPTTIRKHPELANLRVGDAIGPLDPSNYQLVNPVSSDRVRIVEDWACKGECHFWPLWAEITIDGGVIVSIMPVEMEPALLARANYLNSEAKLAARELDGSSYVQMRGGLRWPAPATPESNELARAAGLTDEDAAALLAADRLRLSIEERAFLDEVAAALRAGVALTPSQIDRVHIVAQNLP